jgi:hypothetical protein
VATRVTLKETAAPRGSGLWRAKLEERSLPARRWLRTLFPARLPRLGLTPCRPGGSPLRRLPRPLLLPKTPRQGMAPLPMRPLTRPAKKIRTRPRRK